MYRVLERFTCTDGKVQYEFVIFVLRVKLSGRCSIVVLVLSAYLLAVCV